QRGGPRVQPHPRLDLDVAHAHRTLLISSTLSTVSALTVCPAHGDPAPRPGPLCPALRCGPAASLTAFPVRGPAARVPVRRPLPRGRRPRGRPRRARPPAGW